ncbi:MAG: YicC family protein [Alphaproteobacteria bacterium]|nr:MAG: YicC family protein [Alphaproteobacteria bacterium]
MTGFAEATGGDTAFAWRWEARSVNGRGLDLRLRLADGAEALEPELRARAQALFARGSVTLGLRLARIGGAATARLDPAALDAAIAALQEAGARARAAGLEIAPVPADRLLALPGVLSGAEAEELLTPERRAALLEGAAAALEGLRAARLAEGAALGGMIRAHLDEIEALAARARETAEARQARSGALLRERVAALLGAGAPVEPERLAQELALIAVKADVTEELDRTHAHVAAARALLRQAGAVGRRLDFLAQELNREANTLCAKAGSADLVAIGLALKAVIDQLREQVQNVE